MTMLETTRIRRVSRPPKRLASLVSGLILGAMLIIVACGDSDDTDQADPAALLADYVEARNAGDLDALMSLYGDDAVVSSHPLDSHSIDDPGNEPVATGLDEIRRLESSVPSFQRPEDATEFFDIEVSGNRASFSQRFFNDEGVCFGGSGNEVTVEDGKITQYDWGGENDAVCE